MEKYFTVAPESKLYNNYFAYKANREEINELFKRFKIEQDIESRAYYVTDKEIYIVPTAKDSELFATILCQPVDDGLQKFKTNSKVGKAWVTLLQNESVSVIRKPMLIMYLNTVGGKFKSRLFDVGDKLYGSLDAAELNLPEGFIEMKASEFFTIIESARE